MKCKFMPLGDNAVIMKFGSEISPLVNADIRKMALLLERKRPDGVIEWTPAYTNLTIFYNPLTAEFKEISKVLKKLYKQAKTEKLPDAAEIVVPTVYGGEFGPDLEFVAKHNNMTVEEVIRIHTDPLYLVYMLGFSPGFPYLGGMNKKIATPRLATPRAKIEAGAVGIAGEQTGIYSLPTPGGWQIIGKTPLKLFDLNREKPSLLQAGDRLRFKQISEDEFIELEKRNNNV